MAIEVVILTPLVVAAIMVIAAGGRYVDARGQVNSAAYAAARAASLTTNQEAAVQAGTQAAEQSMSRTRTRLREPHGVRRRGRLQPRR